MKTLGNSRNYEIINTLVSILMTFSQHDVMVLREDHS